MKESEYAIRVRNVCKSYHLYDRPEDRLKQFLWRGRKQFFRDFHALQDISFDLPKVRTIGIRSINERLIEVSTVRG
jgi:lipopolysaccharide transport system ATP-binding protein